MSNRSDIYRKYYDSDIFNTNPNYTKATVPNPKPKLNRPTYESTKEDVFNIGKEKRIKRNINKNEENNQILSRSAAKRKNNYDKIYGSDIFNNGRPTSTERRRGVKQIPNATNQSTYLKEMGNNDEYVKDLKYYTSQHRAEKKEYNPDIYLDKITPQERYYKEHFQNHGSDVLPEAKTNKYSDRNENLDDKKVNDYIHNKINLKNEINKYNNVGADKKGKPGEVNYQEKRYFKQKPVLYEGRRNFVDSNQANNCKINKQIQMESHIFSNENKNKDFNQEVKEINDRLVNEQKKQYNTNVLGQPYNTVKNDNINNDRSIYGSAHSKWNRTNLDWKSPECEILFNNDNRKQTARERKINQLADSQNIDILSGLQKEPINYKMAEEEQEKINKDINKIDEIVNEIPNLNEGQKLGIKMKASALDCNNAREWDNKGKLLNDFYANKNNKTNKPKEVTGKVNDKKNRINNDSKKNVNNDMTCHDYIITYSTKGNQFEKFDEAEIQKLLGNKGIQAYDIHKNPFDKGNYNTINIKIKGNDYNNELYNKVKKVQEDLRKQNYKINIEKGAIKNHGINGKFVNNPGSKIAIMQDNTYEGPKHKVMTNELKSRKGFTKQYGNQNSGYKKPNW